MNVFKREPYEPCSQIAPLTSIKDGGNDLMMLIINNDLKKDYLGPLQDDLKVRKLLIELVD